MLFLRKQKVLICKQTGDVNTKNYAHTLVALSYCYRITVYRKALRIHYTKGKNTT